MLQAESERALEFENVMLREDAADVWAKSLTTPKELTLGKQRVLEAIQWSIVETWRHSFELAEAHLLSADVW